MTALDVKVEMDKWYHDRTEEYMAKYMATGDRCYLGMSRAFSESKIHLQELGIKRKEEGETDGV